MKKVITVKQQEHDVYDPAKHCYENKSEYKIVKLQNTVAWKIGGWLTRQDVNEIISNKIAEVIIT